MNEAWKNKSGNNELTEKAKTVKQSQKTLALLKTQEKDEALLKIADALEKESDSILAANEKDVRSGKENGMSTSLLDRLALSGERIHAMAEGVRQVAALKDPIGEIMEEFTRPNGLHIKKVRVPLGAIGMVYEARPNVTVDSAALAIKAGNGILLRGSGSALHSNRRLTEVMKAALRTSAVPADVLELLEDKSHQAVMDMLNLTEYLDLIIPRGGASLIRNVVKNSRVPVLETGVGNCHIFIDESCSLKMAADIVRNAKTQRPSVCNAAETLLVHKNWADKLPSLLESLKQARVTIHGDSDVCRMDSAAVPAVESDYTDEYLSLDMAVKIVEDTDAAIEHIARYGTGHTECILTENPENAEKFLNRVDAACVNHNASTRFTDGFEFGFGAEIGISTQKLHARGPLGLKELTSYKYLVLGNGQIRD